MQSSDHCTNKKYPSSSFKDNETQQTVYYFNVIIQNGKGHDFRGYISCTTDTVIGTKQDINVNKNVI